MSRNIGTDCRPPRVVRFPSAERRSQGDFRVLICFERPVLFLDRRPCGRNRGQAHFAEFYLSLPVAIN
jgi:hypothetical protein